LYKDPVLRFKVQLLYTYLNIIRFEVSINSTLENRREGLKMREFVVAFLKIAIYSKSKLPEIHFQTCIV